MSKYKLNLDSVLSNIDVKDRTYFDGLTAEEKKSFAGIVMLRFMSSASGAYADFSLIAANEVNAHFHEMYEQPDLQYLLLTAAASGDRIKHQWIAGAKKPGAAILTTFISRFWPEANRMERELVLSKFDQKSFAEFVDGCGVDQEEAKKLKQSFNAR